MSRIGIVMSTYNGSKFIDSQVKSILTQDFSELALSVVDDCSTDDTVAKLERWAAVDERLAISASTSNRGVNGSFQRGLKLVEKCDFYCLSDQDDIWPTNRLSSFLAEAERTTERIGVDTPILFVCQYRTFYDETSLQGNSTSAELLGILNPDSRWKSELLAGNPLYGCCFFFNHALKSRIEEIPVGRTTHDYWIALVASYLGEIYVLPFIGTHYRQHANNASFGAPSNSLMTKVRRIRRSIREELRGRGDVSLLLVELLRQHGYQLGESDRALLEKGAAAYRRGAMSLIWFQLSHRIWKKRFLANLLRCISCLVELLALRRFFS